MGEDDDRGVLRPRLQVPAEPVDLRVAQDALGVGDVVEHDEVHALVIEGVPQGPEELLESRAAIERSVVFARHQPQSGDPQTGEVLADLPHAPPALLVVVGGVGKVAGENHEIGNLRESVDQLDRPGQLDGRLRVGGTLVAPVRVGELDEVEVVRHAWARIGPPSQPGACLEQPRSEDHSSNAGDLEKFTPRPRTHRSPPGCAASSAVGDVDGSFPSLIPPGIRWLPSQSARCDARPSSSHAFLGDVRARKTPAAGRWPDVPCGDGSAAQ